MTAECGLYMLQHHKRISCCDVRFNLRQTKNKVKFKKKKRNNQQRTSDVKKPFRKLLPKHRNRTVTRKCEQRSERTIRSSVQEIMACSLTSGREVHEAGDNIQSAAAIMSHIKLRKAPCVRLRHCLSLEEMLISHWLLWDPGVVKMINLRLKRPALPLR